jgi:uncharacterized protein YecE (DUF72 family)
MGDAGSTRIGTSGWHYRHWLGPFYPEGMKREEFLGFYSERFDTVEVNNSFYQVPEAETLDAWRRGSPEGFVFSVKASRYITHMKKLKDPGEPVAKFIDRVELLGEKLGPVLFQLPPGWRVNPDRLRAFLEELPEGYRYAFEFRDTSWFDRRVYDALFEYNAAFCIYDLAGVQSPREATADFVYIRLHGPGDAYEGRYGKKSLAKWAGAITGWSRQGRDVYCYFDNDRNGYATLDAADLQRMTS